MHSTHIIYSYVVWFVSQNRWERKLPGARLFIHYTHTTISTCSTRKIIHIIYSYYINRLMQYILQYIYSAGAGVSVTLLPTAHWTCWLYLQFSFSLLFKSSFSIFPCMPFVTTCLDAIRFPLRSHIYLIYTY